MSPTSDFDRLARNMATAITTSFVGPYEDIALSAPRYDRRYPIVYDDTGLPAQFIGFRVGNTYGSQQTTNNGAGCMG